MTKFMDQIISYNNQAINAGWIDKPPVIVFTKQGLDTIKNNPYDKEHINKFLAKLEEYYSKNMILSEAYVLLKYNLQYLLSKI